MAMAAQCINKPRLYLFICFVDGRGLNSCMQHISSFGMARDQMWIVGKPEVLKAMFNFVDTNGDGVLQVHEFMRAFDPRIVLRISRYGAWTCMILPQKHGGPVGGVTGGMHAIWLVKVRGI